MRAIALTAALLPLAACGDDQRPAAAADAAADAVADVAPDAAAAADAATDAASVAPDATAPPIDPSDQLFPTDRVLEITLTLPTADFTRLRHQTRTLLDILDAVCADSPVPDVFTWFRADATVDGTALPAIAVRKKGFLGSLDAVRPSLELDLAEFVAGQSLAGLDRLTLNNGRQDATRFRTGLAYDVFRRAGLPAPRCAFAHLRVNGEDLGLYVHVEAMKKAFVRRHFPEPLGELIEGSVSDFRPGWTGTFEPKNDADVPSPGLIAAVTAAAAAPDDALFAALDAVIDLDQFFRFWAAEVLVGHWDGYASNANSFLVYADPRDGRLRFLPWGADSAFAPPPRRRPRRPGRPLPHQRPARASARPAGRSRPLRRRPARAPRHRLRRGRAQRRARPPRPPDGPRPRPRHLRRRRRRHPRDPRLHLRPSRRHSGRARRPARAAAGAPRPPLRRRPRRRHRHLRHHLGHPRRRRPLLHRHRVDDLRHRALHRHAPRRRQQDRLGPRAPERRSRPARRARRARRLRRRRPAAPARSPGPWRP